MLLSPQLNLLQCLRLGFTAGKQQRFVYNLCNKVVVLIKANSFQNSPFSSRPDRDDLQLGEKDNFHMHVFA